MSIADEVRSVLQEVGSAIILRKWNGVEVLGEYFDDTSHTEHTNPSIRAFFYDFSFHHPTAAEVGDTVIWGENPHQLEILITAMAPQFFANEVVEYIASGYVVNTRGAFWYYDQEDTTDDPPDLDELTVWKVLYSGIEIHGTIMDRLFRSMVKSTADESIDVALERLQLFVSAQFTNVKMGMQWRSTTGRIYKVDHIEDHNFVGIRSVFLSEETRP